MKTLVVLDRAEALSMLKGETYTLRIGDADVGLQVEGARARRVVRRRTRRMVRTAARNGRVRAPRRDARLRGLDAAGPVECKICHEVLKSPRALGGHMSRHGKKSKKK